MWSLRVLIFTVFAAAVATGLLHASVREPQTSVISYAETMWPANCRDSLSYGGSPKRPKSTRRPASQYQSSSAITTTTYISSVIASIPANSSSVLESARSISDAGIAYILSSINNSTSKGALADDRIQTVRFLPSLRTQDSDGVWRMTPRTRIKSTLAALFGVFLIFAIKM